MIRDDHPGSRIRILAFTHPGSRTQGLKRHRIPDPDPQHSLKVNHLYLAAILNCSLNYRLFIANNLLRFAMRKSDQ
jgi:hypothetical protein